MGSTLFTLFGKQSKPSRLEDLMDRSCEPIHMIFRLCYPSKHNDYEEFDPNRPSTILRSMLSGTDLLTMRLVSRASAKWTQEEMGQTFETLYVSPRYSYPNRRQSIKGLHGVGKYCRQLVVRIHEGRRAVGPADVFVENPVEPPQSFSHTFTSTAHGLQAAMLGRPRARTTVETEPRTTTDAEPSDRLTRILKTLDLSPPFRKIAAPPARPPARTERASDWSEVFKHVKGLTSLTLSAPYGSKTEKLSHIKAIILSLRMAVEEAYLPCVRTLRIDPVYPLNITHFRGSGNASAGEDKWASEGFWSKITTLEVQVIYQPAGLSESQHDTFLTILNKWLHGFCEHLKVLKFNWIGTDGPNPLALHEEPGLYSWPLAWNWPRLEELWVGGLKTDAEHTATVCHKAEHLVRYMLLDEAQAEGARDRPIDFSDDHTWRKVDVSSKPSAAGEVHASNGNTQQSTMEEDTVPEASELYDEPASRSGHSTDSEGEEVHFMLEI